MSQFSEAQIVILEAAEKLFLSQGYNGTSIRDLASGAGYRSVSGLYNYFPDKESIFRALLVYRSPYPVIFPILERLEAHTADDFLKQFFYELTSYMQTHPHFFRLALIDYLEFQAAHLQQIISDLQAQFPLIFARLATLEGLRQDVPPLFIIRFMGMQLFGYLMTSSILPAEILNTLSEDEWKQHFISVYLHGLKGD